MAAVAFPLERRVRHALKVGVPGGVVLVGSRCDTKRGGCRKLLLRRGQGRRATAEAELVEDSERGCRTPKDVRGTRQARQRDGFEQVCAEGTITCRCVRSAGVECPGD